MRSSTTPLSKLANGLKQCSFPLSGGRRAARSQLSTAVINSSFTRSPTMGTACGLSSLNATALN